MMARWFLSGLIAIALAPVCAPAQQSKPSAPMPKQGETVEKPVARRRQRVVSDLSGFDLLESGKTRKQTMVAGATRGMPRPVALAPRLGKLYGKIPFFAWNYEGKAKNFIFVLWNDAKEQVFRAEVTGTRYRYPEDAPALQPGKTYLWTVESAMALMGGGPSASVGFIVVSSEQRATIEKALAKKAGPSSYDTARTHARFFTDQRLWYDALAAYDELIAQYPDRAELYEERGTIYAQLDATQALAEADFARAEQLQPGLPTPK